MATIPGKLKLWFTIYFPILVLPVLSKFMAANNVGYPGKTKSLFTAGNIAINADGGSPSAIPNGIIVLVVAAWLNIKAPIIKTAMEKVHG